MQSWVLFISVTWWWCNDAFHWSIIVNCQLQITHALCDSHLQSVLHYICQIIYRWQN